MNIKYLMFLFFIKILHIIPNTLYIDEDIFIKDDFVNLDWLKEAVLSNNNIVISKIDKRKNEKIEDYNYSYKTGVKLKDDPTKDEIITIVYKKQLIYNFKGKFLKINIENTSNLRELIKNINDVKNKKTDLKGDLIKLDKNISEIDVKIDIYSYEKDKEYNYEYIVLDKNTNNVIKQLKFNENSTDNPLVFMINMEEYLYFFSYFQCNNNGIFENSKIEHFCHKIFLKENDINFKGLFKNSFIEDYRNLRILNNKLINCDEMFLNCKKLEDFNSKKEYLFYGKSIFENCENLENGYGFWNMYNDEIEKIPIKKNHLKNCKKIGFSTNKIHFVINKDTEKEDMEDVFYNVENNPEYKKIYLKIEKDTKISVELDKIFNNHKLEEIIIEDNGEVAIFGSKKLLETGTLKKIKLIVKQENKEKNIEEKNYILDLTDKELMKYLKEEKKVEDIINIFFDAPNIVNDNIEKFNIKREEEKRKKEQEQNNNNDIDEKNLNMNKNTANCLFCCSKCNCC